MDFFKKILAVVAGIISGSLVLTISDYAIDLLNPLPDYILPEDKSAIAEHYASASLYVHIITILFWGITGFVSGGVATYLAPIKKPTYAYFCGLIFLCASVFFLVTNPRDWWMWVAAFLIWIPTTHIAYSLVAKLK